MPIDFREKNMPLQEPSVLAEPSPGSQRINNSTQKVRDQYRPVRVREKERYILSYLPNAHLHH